MADGRLNVCKACKCAYQAARPREVLREIESRRNKKPARRAAIAQRTKHWRAKHPERTKAHRKVKYALSTGVLSRQPCEVCGTTEHVHAHHDDYSKPLEVRWLCARHHHEHHEKMRCSGATP